VHREYENNIEKKPKDYVIKKKHLDLSILGIDDYDKKLYKNKKE
jgi:hypothetical protein